MRLLTASGVLFFLALLVGALFLSGYMLGESRAKARLEQQVKDAEEKARKTEEKWRGEGEESMKRMSEREIALEHRRKVMDNAWKALMDALPDCDLPPDIGLQLNRASGLPAPAGVAHPPAAPESVPPHGG